ncbi:Zinc/iron permease [Dactylonectria macrodidyma]|uniref:Zinc/iron permease n=1 Tax=Dactylonectria macrodidyma TaxID=307937 RepID=A0A9P9FQT0_9HYPO|nr:Zinc/iron permease [Dactylonectria macrodidyma]
MALSIRDVDNDTRGWIMCVVSGIACVVGASVICVDIIVRLFPGKRHFRIQDSNGFLACSLSLSFGVMLFSALYSMLPESKEYLKGDGWSDQTAGLIMMSCFIGGFIGIQAVSRFLHQHMPTHVVDCDHTHDETAKDAHSAHHHRRQSRSSRTRRRLSHRPSSRPKMDNSILSRENGNGHAILSETTPLLDSEYGSRPNSQKRHASTRSSKMTQQSISPAGISRSRATTGNSESTERRSSILQVHKRVMSFVQDTKCNCDESGSCYGYTDPCGQECFKHLNNRSVTPLRQQTVLRITTGSVPPVAAPHSHHHDHDHDHAHEDDSDDAHDHLDHHHSHASENPISPTFRTSRATSREPLDPMCEEEEEEDEGEDDGSCSPMEEDEDVEAQHHHHVPTNAFLSIGLQTSIAIALHKFPEGFITYATNHANPTLGFNVFMALFVHNITEGFAMCLPLYMALGSRWRAIAWSAALGGLSQPFGAGIAALWFKLASRTHMAPNAVAYACLFATTSGIMVSVALQLFVEGLSLNHNRNLCIFFGFLGMALLGVSNALVGAH